MLPKLVKWIFLFVLLCLLVSSASAWLTGFDYRQKHYINGSDDGTLTNYPVKIYFFNTSGSSSGDTCYLGSHINQSDWDDLRITQTDDTLISYWIESTNATAAVVWAKIPSIASGSTTQTEIYAYYGNSSVSGVSDGYATFLLYDHFPGVAANATTWTITGSVSVSSSIARLASAATYGSLESKTGLGFNYTMRYYGLHNVSSRYHMAGFIVVGYASYGIFYGNKPNSGNLSPYNYIPTGNTYGTDVGGMDAYHIYEIKRSSNTSFNYTVDDGGLQALTTNVSTSVNARVHLFSQSITYLDVDWITLRPSTPNEPVQDEWGAEASGSPIAAFSANVTSGCPMMNVSFTDASLNSPTNWSWDFGDTGTSFDQNPVHHYTSPGVYTVKLNASTSYGYDWENKTDYITVSSVIANFTGTPTYAEAPENVSFTSTSLCSPTSWYWDFGDGGNSTLENPTHTYADGGLYTVSLNVSDGTNFDWENKTNYINLTGYLNWIEATPHAHIPSGWADRSGFVSLVYDNKMWVMGGYSGAVSVNDVWYSTDGVNWTEATDHAGWSARDKFSGLVYDNKMWIMGGQQWDLTDLNDVWYSTDGVNWVEANTSAGWWPRHSFTSTVYDNKMWVMAGDNGIIWVDDVWYSTDGVSWTVATWDAGFGAREGLSVTYDNKMWIMGGVFGNASIWYSTDGVNWTEVVEDAGWPGRSFFGLVEYNDRLWVMGGGGYFNDVWASTNGVNWTRITSTNIWSERAAFGSTLVYNNSMWVMGGYNSTTQNDEVWYTEEQPPSATIYWDKDIYFQGYPANITYSIWGYYWDSEDYNYSIEVTPISDITDLIELFTTTTNTGYNLTTISSTLYDQDDYYALLYMTEKANSTNKILLAYDNMSVIASVNETIPKFPPHSVRFVLQDYFGAPLTDVWVYATPIETTLCSWSWLGGLFGMNITETNYVNTTMNGSTGLDGSIDFIMYPTIKYNITCVGGTYGINYQTAIYPQENEIYLHIPTLNAPNTSSSVTYTTPNVSFVPDAVGGVPGLNQWLALGTLLLVGTMFSKKSVKVAAVIVPLFGLFFYYIDWLEMNAMGLSILVSLLALGLLSYIRKAETVIGSK